MFRFLLFVLLNNLRFLFIFCINVDIDEMLLLEKKKDLGLIPLELFLFVLLEKLLWFDNMVHACIYGEINSSQSIC